jgi:hypothetical protein
VLAIIHVFSVAHLLTRNVFKSTLGQLSDVFHRDPTECFLSNLQHKLKLLAESASPVYCPAALIIATQINNCAAESAALWISISSRQLRFPSFALKSLTQ